MKYGKYLETKQLELPEYIGHFIDYKGLKKVIKTLAEINQPIQISRSAFFFKVERELEKVNSFYLEKQAQVKLRSDILTQRLYKEPNNATLLWQFKSLKSAVSTLSQFVELNETGFRKILKKWDKRTQSHMQEVYLSTTVHVQPVFDHQDLDSLSDHIANCLLQLQGAALSVSPPVTVEKDDTLFSELASIAAAETRRLVLLSGWLTKLKHVKDTQRLTHVLYSASQSIDDEVLQGFFEFFKPYFDLGFVEEYTGKTLLHVAASKRAHSQQCFLAEAVYLQHPELVVHPDAVRQTPIHVAAATGRDDLLRMFLGGTIGAKSETQEAQETQKQGESPQIQLTTPVSFSSLPLPPLDPSAPSPLSLAVRGGHASCVALLVNFPGSTAPGPDGLGALHTAACYGHFQLIPQLVAASHDPRASCSSRHWPPIFYSAYHGHVRTTRALLECGASAMVVDSKGRTPLYYAGLRGHLETVNVLAQYEGSQEAGSKGDDFQASLVTTVPPLPLDSMPSLSLPPPLIPLRKYGHNFLENRTALELQFPPGGECFRLLGQRELDVGRMTITSSAPGTVPRNVSLPVAEDASPVIFHLLPDDKKITLEFEIYPKFGTKIVAKAVALEYVFSDQFGTANLPLLDARLVVVGEIVCRYQLIQGYRGTPLEVAKYETYWRSSHDEDDESQPVLSLGTSSSLSGSYLRLGLCISSDGVPLVSPHTTIAVGHNLKLPILGLSSGEVSRLSRPVADLSSFSGGDSALQELENISARLSQTYCSLATLLESLPMDVAINLDIFYPTAIEVSAIFKGNGVAAPSKLNDSIDQILTVVFDQVRNSSRRRQLVFSSSNPMVCKILNWKQPNFPVFFAMGGVYYNYKSRQFETTTANSFYLGRDCKEEVCTRSVEKAISFASENNLIGLVVSSKLIQLVPEIAKAVVSKGLILVGSKEDPRVFNDMAKEDTCGEMTGDVDDDKIEGIDIQQDIDLEDNFSKEGVNGVRTNSVLEFEGSIEM